MDLTRFVRKVLCSRVLTLAKSELARAFIESSSTVLQVACVSACGVARARAVLTAWLGRSTTSSGRCL